ncbi:UrcA family protein [Sphingosinicellaceae bacterium]|nr:UrcA family protein [Sphingosinicellaceae bacterium]
MILDHQATRLLADHNHDWTAIFGQAVVGLRRWLGSRRSAGAVTASATTFPKIQESAMSLNFSHTIVRAALGIFGTAICAGLCLAAAAGASPIVENPALADTVRVQTVSYADLDLSTPQGRAALNR